MLLLLNCYEWSRVEIRANHTAANLGFLPLGSKCVPWVEMCPLFYSTVQVVPSSCENTVSTCIFGVEVIQKVKTFFSHITQVLGGLWVFGSLLRYCSNILNRDFLLFFS